MLHVTCMIKHPDGVVERITSEEISRLYDMSVADYQAFVASEPIGDNGRMLEARRAAVAESRRIATLKASLSKKKQSRTCVGSRKASEKVVKSGSQQSKGLKRSKKGKQTTNQNEAKGRAPQDKSKVAPRTDGTVAPKNAKRGQGPIGTKVIPTVGSHKPVIKPVKSTGVKRSLIGGMKSSGIRSKESYNQTPVAEELTTEERRKKWQKPNIDTSRMSGSNASRHSASSSYKVPSDYSPFSDDDVPPFNPLYY